MASNGVSSTMTFIPSWYSCLVNYIRTQRSRVNLTITAPEPSTLLFLCLGLLSLMGLTLAKKPTQLRLAFLRHYNPFSLPSSHSS